MPDALQIGHRSAAEFHDDLGHAWFAPVPFGAYIDGRWPMLNAETAGQQ